MGAITWLTRSSRRKYFASQFWPMTRRAPNVEPFFEELNRLGYIAEQNAKIELWNAEGRADELPNSPKR